MFKSLTAQWTQAGYFKKFVLVNLVIPWTPIIMLSLAYFAPPEVVEVVAENGKLVGEVADASWQLASYFFAKFLGL